MSNASGLTVAPLLFRSAPTAIRILQSLRPHICPFEVLLEKLPYTGRLLDVGCGAGLFVGLACTRRPGLRAVGFDTSASAIGAAVQMARENFLDGRAGFRQLDAEDEWPDGPFEAVSMIDVLHHISPEAQQHAIEQCWSALAPGGVLIYKDMADRPLLKAWWNRLHDLVVARQWIHYRAITDVRSWLQSLGAEIEEDAALAIGPYAHEWIVARKPVKSIPR